MLGFHEIATTDQARDIRVEARPHRVALAGDAIRAGAGLADVARHQCEIDDGLRSADGFVALVHAHRPPERNGFAAMNALRTAIDFANGQTSFRRDLVWRELAHKLSELRVARRALLDELAIHPAVLHEQVREAVEQREVGLGCEREMLRGAGGRLCATRINDDDVRVIFVP